MSKRSKNANLQKLSIYDQFASIWRQNDLKSWVTYQNYKSDQITMNCIDLMSKRSKMLSYVAKHSKERKTIKLSELQWIASIWCQNDQKTQNYKSNYITINLHLFDVKTIKNVEVRRKTFKTTQNYESDQIIMNCIDLSSNGSKLLGQVAKLQK